MVPRLVGIHNPSVRHRLLQQTVSGGGLTSNFAPHVGVVRLIPERGQARASGREADRPPRQWASGLQRQKLEFEAVNDDDDSTGTQLLPPIGEKHGAIG